MDSLWLAITSLGRDEVFLVVLSLYTLLVSPRGGRDLGVAFALSYLVNSALKYGLNLPRPFTDDPALASAAARATAGGPGLPSGHAQMSATLWLGIAAQVRRPAFTLFAAVLVALIIASRLVLHVHFPSDVVVGLLLGLAFAYLGTHGQFNQQGAGRWAIPLVLLALSALLPAGTPREYSAGLGLLAGYWAGRADFAPPHDWAGRLVVGVLGLVLIFAVYLGLGAALGALGHSPLLRALRYAAVVLVALHGVPLLLGRWLPHTASGIWDTKQKEPQPGL
ncbi:phosphatase PAP2 family protein [Deinococcus radiodurans]|jgi:PAP2 superfamily.|uniref:phosphatase PAP2 family protein n=1 Tax=Deinococcus radiodurans TaxID=1299 RepID=UPI00068E142E|nr:phosphatase PAP2 family protein [Deinococcus radiodurans]ANC71851.1 phosphoesterase [Deinococcus radiodurans R1 = ATCC 13939 = DSM 20539]QIP29064.1 phosphatase PAP2 family protein [Deinococcus radiodurans]QIP32231.1 phosphatase PAP2 family protein [Deinococcus radiodurans]UID69949.1 phosphoesterase [Deinococcus radiodurans R1 = ATCC 13939 = DSM 20539]UTA50494.1 phosphatase PAP2 family protein [Deinococcus radiodurans]